MPIPPTGLSRLRPRCRWDGGSTSLVREPDESWRAWALPGPHAGDPNAAPIEGRGLAAEHALKALARNAREMRGEMSGR